LNFQATFSQTLNGFIETHLLLKTEEILRIEDYLRTLQNKKKGSENRIEYFDSDER
jgi:hypothetical protein